MCNFAYKLLFSTFQTMSTIYIYRNEKLIVFIGKALFHIEQKTISHSFPNQAMKSL